MDDEKWYKILAMAVLGGGSFLSGLLPAIISERNRTRFPLLISILLCFGAGVLLATAMVHILPEIHNQMNSNFAEISLCGGFFIIYFIDEFIHYFFGEGNQQSNNNSQTVSHRNYGSLNNEHEREPLLGGNHHEHNETDSGYTPEQNLNDDNHNTNHSEECAQSITGTLGLFVALSLHSAIEGLAIGVQSSSSKVLFLLGAVSCHKFVMGFCLGLEFRASTSLRFHFIGMLVFSLGAVVGIGLGMLIVDIPAEWTKTILPVIQAIAGGTLLYVTICEVLPRERSKWHHDLTRKSAGFCQFASVFSGFTVMCLLSFFMSDGD